ncbi:SDR family oxidoreductase [Herbiconiux sp.]|uniref:SDR family oxidoreductase n=1 Tax=Herbiconiux sp. TaxID=1871186 RepID=UPI0025BB8987|nr:SDR family oxidoreductase [Herbiconiux sp.]
MKNQFRLDGSVALVTGAGSGIGRAIAIGLARAGAAVAAVDLTAERVAGTVAAIEQEGGRALAVAADVSTDQISDAVDEAQRTLGPLEVAVNSAGIARAVPARDMTVEEFEAMYRINVTGVFRSCQAEARAMAARGGGSIVNLASISGIVSHRQMLQAHYNSSKAAVAHLTRSLATEWAADGIRVNALSPGFTLTPMNLRDEVASIRESVSHEIPLGRFAEPAELVGPAIFLLSEASSYCTGVNLVVDGGFTLL